MLDTKQLRKDVDKLAAHNKELCNRHDVDEVNFHPHYDEVSLINLIRLVKEAGEANYLTSVHFGNQRVLFAEFVTEKKQRFTINAKAE